MISQVICTIWLQYDFTSVKLSNMSTHNIDQNNEKTKNANFAMKFCIWS